MQNDCSTSQKTVKIKALQDAISGLAAVQKDVQIEDKVSLWL